MAQLLNVHPCCGAGGRHLPAPSRPKPTSPSCNGILVRNAKASSEWEALQREVKGGGRSFCFFSDSRKEEQARKALESALGEKKTEFEKWNKEIEKRESDGGGASGQGGWFGGGGGGGWFGWSRDEHFWDEAKQAGVTVAGLVLLYLLLTKGNVIFAVVFNSLLLPLRGVRNWFEFLLARSSGKVPPVAPVKVNNTHEKARMSAKERVVSKWGTD